MPKVKWGIKSSAKNLTVNPVSYFFWRIKNWWKRRGYTRRYKATDWPYVYIGPDVKPFSLQTGVFLRCAPGPKGSQLGRRWECTDGVIRVIPYNQVEKREGTTRW